MMKAAVWYGNKDIRVENRVIEAPGAEEVQIKVSKAGICGTDLHEWWAGPIFMPVNVPHPLTGKVAPLIAGHEFSGVIAAVGEKIKTLKVGDRVTSDSATWCGGCNNCLKGWYSLCEKCAFLGLSRDGGYAEYVNVPVVSVFKLPDNVSFEWGAMVEPFACALHVLHRSKIMIGESIVIIGTGPIGLMCAHLAKIAGASKVFVIARTESKKRLANKIGSIVLDPASSDIIKSIKEQTAGKGADVALEVVGNEETIDLSLKTVKTRGRVVLVGFPEEKPVVDWNVILYNELEVIGILNNGGEIPQVLELMANGTIDAEPFITGRIGLSEIVEKGYEELKYNKGHIKILIDPTL
jgi:(R,R)-butanediol dehydrogenase / meso-butanediol dehydrogenase / diacetyl reductase